MRHLPGMLLGSACVPFSGLFLKGRWPPNIFLLQFLLEFKKSLEEIEENLEGSLGNGCVLGIIGLGQGLCCSVSGDLRWFCQTVQVGLAAEGSSWRSHCSLRLGGTPYCYNYQPASFLALEGPYLSFSPLWCFSFPIHGSPSATEQPWYILLCSLGLTVCCALCRLFQLLGQLLDFSCWAELVKNSRNVSLGSSIQLPFYVWSPGQAAVVLELKPALFPPAQVCCILVLSPLFPRYHPGWEYAHFPWGKGEHGLEGR